jgi:hypothetical protein
MTALAVVGMGMVSPLGLTAAEHAFFLRAEVGPPSPGAFLDDQGERIPVACCPWLGARRPPAERLAALATRALEDALDPFRRHVAAASPGGPRPAPDALFVCTAAPRIGLEEADRKAAKNALLASIEGQRYTRCTGEAGFFQAIAEAGALLSQGAARAIAAVAVDSLICPAAIAEHRRVATTPWESNLPRPGEAAAAVLLMLPIEARRQGLEILAVVHHSATAAGEANDDNDAIVDGAAMTRLLRGIPRLGRPIGASFGQHGTGGLRRREWEMAAARCASMFETTCPFIGLEREIGCIGAAAGAASFVYGIAVHRHNAWPDAPREDDPFVAWAISRDGTRGLCAATIRGGVG